MKKNEKMEFPNYESSADRFRSSHVDKNRNKQDSSAPAKTRLTAVRD